MNSNTNGRIGLMSRLCSINEAEVDELERLCNENGIEFQNSVFRTDSVQMSALWSWFTLAVSPEVISALVLGVVSAGAYDLIKWTAIKVVNKLRNEQPVPSKTDRSSVVELKSSSAYLKIESDQVTDETLSKAFDTFIKVSECTYCEDRKIPTYVVINGDNDIVVMNQNDYIWKYIVPQKNAAEDGKDGQL